MLRRRVLAAIIIVIILSSILVVWTVRERIWEKPDIRRTIVVLADSKDYSSASGLIDFFKAMDLQVIHVKASDLANYKSYGLIIILGGSYSEEGVWDIIWEVLTREEWEHVSASGNGATYLKKDVWAKGQQVVVYAGSNRDQTEEEWVQTLTPPPDINLTRPTLIYTLPLRAGNSSLWTSMPAGLLSSVESIHLSQQDEEHECDSDSAGPRQKFGTGEVTGVGPFDLYPEFQDYVDIKIFNPACLTQDIDELMAASTSFSGLKDWFVGPGGRLETWIQDQLDSIYRIEITIEHAPTCSRYVEGRQSTTYTVDLKELGNCFQSITDLSQRLSEYGNLIESLTCPECGGQITVRWPPISLEDSLDDLRAELTGTGDIEEFLENFLGTDEEVTQFPWGLIPPPFTWTVPCASAGITPPPVVWVLPKPVFFFLSHAEGEAVRQSYGPTGPELWMNMAVKDCQEGQLTRHASNWMLLAPHMFDIEQVSRAWCWQIEPEYVGASVHDTFRYFVQHTLVVYASQAIPGCDPILIDGVPVGYTPPKFPPIIPWGHSDSVHFSSVLPPSELIPLGYEFEGWIVDGNQAGYNGVIPFQMNQPHEIVAVFRKAGTEPPYVTMFGPDGSDVPVTANIRVVFSKDMDPTSTEAAFSISPAVPGTFSWLSANTMLFTPSVSLAFSSTYAVRISTAAADTTGSHPRFDHNWDFRTRRGPTLELLTRMPLIAGARPTAIVGEDLPIIARTYYSDGLPARLKDVDFDKSGVVSDFDRYPPTARTDDNGEATVCWIAGSNPGIATITALATVEGILVQDSLDITVIYGAWRLLQNNGFEDWVGDVIPRYWARDSEAEGLLAISTDSHFGHYSVELGGIMIISQIVEAQPNKFTDFGFWMKLSYPTPLQVNTELQWLDSSYNIINVRSFPANPDGTWRRYAIDTTWPGPFISPANTAYAKIVFKAELGVTEMSTILIDDVFFGQAIPLPPLSVDVWTNKGGQGLNMPDGSYYVGETVVISFSINVNATVRLTVIKPDGTTLTYGPESFAAGVYPLTFQAGYPPGQRVVVLEAWVGDQHASDTVVFTVLEGE